MMRQENREADLWVRQVVLELKNEYSELIYPISMLTFEECRIDKLQAGFSTDGTTVYYHPEYILENRKTELKKQLLHIVLHGLLGHFEIKDDYAHKIYRDFMMDMQVEYMSMKMQGEHLQDHKHLWKKLDAYVQGDYSMSIYRRLCEETISTTCIDYYYHMVKMDNHEIWDKGKDEKQSKACIKLWGKIREKLLGERKASLGANDDMDKLADTVGGKEGTDEGSVFKTGRGKSVNYKELLEKLVSIRKTDKEEPDSIDFMLYQYGLELYEEVPLIEPTEETVSNANMIAIAVDVSGSCVSDEQMKRFWGETYECLLRLKECYKEVEMILLQCDDVIRQEKKFNLQEWREIPEEVTVYGGGGTSFVPVFERLTELEKAGNKIDALLYYTDGFGEYPKEKPNYPVYFILENTSETYQKIPEWVDTVKLQ